MPPKTPGLFITGTDTGVGKTYVGALIAKTLVAAGHRVGVYKPAASGCPMLDGKLVSEDAIALWNAAGRPGEFERVCPQQFAAPLTPHLAAQIEGKQLDANLLRNGIHYWQERSDIVIVEGAGGLLSPLGPCEYVADLVHVFGYPLVIVSRNSLGTINHTLQTLIAAATLHGGLPVAAIVLNHPAPASADDISLTTNRDELATRSSCPIFAEATWQADRLKPEVDWFSIAQANQAK
jgi:dethiobiotin synthetase